MEPGAQRQLQARFWKKLQLLTRGRLDVLRAMEVIVAEEQDAAFRAVLAELHGALGGGTPLSEALAEQPAAFSRSVRALVRSAEQTGAWDEILPLIAAGLADGTLD